MKELKALFVTLLMIAMAFMGLPWGMPNVKATTVTSFGSGTTNVTVPFASGGTSSSTEIVLPGDADVSAATFNITGLPHTQDGKDYPANVTVDVGNDGKVDWAWNSAINGHLGYQDKFTNGNSSVSVNLMGAGTDTSNALRLPTGSKVTGASFNVSGGNVQYFNEKVYYGDQWDFMGYSVSPAGDLNGDGYQDFIAGGPHKGWGMWNYGHVMVVFGGPTLPDTPSLVIQGTLDDEAFGSTVAAAGDVNGDGYDDIIVGAPYWGNSTWWEVGAAYIYYGGPNMDGVPDVTLRGFGEYDKFGYSIAGIGDVNSDGFDDVIVGAPYNDTAVGSDRGAAYVYYGGAPMNKVPDYVFYGANDDNELGVFVANVSDINGDGRTDFMIGADGEANGAVHVVFGNATFDPNLTLTIRPLTGFYFGIYGNGVGDLNGDGYQDIAIMNNDNEIWIFYGGNPMDDNMDLMLSGEGVWDYFGYAIASVRDLNKDGCDELLVGAFAYNNSQYQVGKTYLYFGGKPMNSKPDYTWKGVKNYDEMGAAVAALGDVNNDGCPDFIMGEDGNDSYLVNAGTVHVMMWACGIKDPTVSLGALKNKLWNWTDYFSGVKDTGDIASKVQTAVNETTPSYTDKYGVSFSNMTVLIDAKSKGDLKVAKLGIEYELLQPTKDLTSVLDDYMNTHQPQNDGKFHIPIKITTDSAGDLKLSGLRVTYGHGPVGTPPSGLKLAEGTSDDRFLDLYTVFTDADDAPANLSFAVTGVTNGTYFWAGISLGHYLSVDSINHSANPNWTGMAQVNVTATDNEAHTTGPLAILIEIFNVEDAPLITSKPVLAAMENTQYQYNVTALDGDKADTITYSLEIAPKGMTINSASGIILWTPARSDLGSLQVRVVASDGKLNATQSFTVQVSPRLTPGNHLPYVTSQPPNVATVGVTYIYQITAFDNDWDPLAYFLEQGPQNMTVNKTSGKVAWLPTMSDIGLKPVSINISDGKDRTFHDWIINVTGTDLNHLPTINGTPPTQGYVGLEVFFAFTSYDQDGDPVAFWLLDGPKTMTLSSAGALSWKPLNSNVGTHTYTIKVTDGKGYSTKTFTIEVSINHVPTADSNPVLNAKVGKSYKYIMIVSDLDTSDTISVELISGPAGMKLDNATRTVNWKPTSSQKGKQAVSIKISDGKQSSYQNFNVTVKGPTQNIFELAGLLILLFVVIAIVCTVVGVFAYMRYKKKKAESKTVIEDVFLIYRDGRLMSHNTRRLKPEQDEHTMTAMLTAIQEFVKDTIPTEGEGQKPIEEISFGKDKILLSHGTLVYIAAVTIGTEYETLRGRMNDTVRKIETEFDPVLKEWDGDLRDLDGAKRYMKELLVGPGEIPEEKGK